MAVDYPTSGPVAIGFDRPVASRRSPPRRRPPGFFFMPLSAPAMFARPSSDEPATHETAHGESPMLYAVLCYNSEEMVCAWTKEEDDAVMAKLSVVHEKWEKAGKLKPSIRLLPTSAATTLLKGKDLVLDGPYAETKEQLLGFYILNCDTLDDALSIARELGEANPGGSYEIRPVAYINTATVPRMAEAT
jgi:hypothetical protein